MPGEIYQLFKSELRGSIESESHKSFITFNQDRYFHESRNPVEILQQFSEHYLSENNRLLFGKEDDNTSIIVIPIEGELKIQSTDEPFRLSPQQVFTFHGKSQIQITNWFPGEISRFYVIQLREVALETSVTDFDSEIKNDLISLLSADSFDFKLGIYSGRKDGKYHAPFNHCFITSINGAFECQNRLMETNDSLLIQGQQSLEFEALSEHAVLFIFSF